jgi:hypothetical protein
MSSGPALVLWCSDMHRIRLRTARRWRQGPGRQPQGGAWPPAWPHSAGPSPLARGNRSAEAGGEGGRPMANVGAALDDPPAAELAAPAMAGDLDVGVRTVTRRRRHRHPTGLLLACVHAPVVAHRGTHLLIVPADFLGASACSAASPVACSRSSRTSSSKGSPHRGTTG